MSARGSPLFFALVDYGDPYVDPLILSALRKRVSPKSCKLLGSLAEYPSEGGPLLQWRQYESIVFEFPLEEKALANAYIIRKALIRKHFLSTTILNWTTKHPDSLLKQHYKQSLDFELDYAEFLDDALVEAFELRESFEKNMGKPAEEREWWILKPGMSDRGQGIRLFSTEEELSAIFEEWEAEQPDSDDENDEAIHSDDDGRDSAVNQESASYVVTSHLRHFVAQSYIHPPLLLPAPFPLANHKFHLRVYVLAVGALRVYVYKPCLALFASKPYLPPWECSNTPDGLIAHLTNTCLQNPSESTNLKNTVHSFWSLPDNLPSSSSSSPPTPPQHLNWKDSIFTQIDSTTSTLFRAAALSTPTHFQPHPNMFEIFGLDFLVDAQMTAWLLEVNAFPDFAMTGEELREGVVGGLFEEVVDVAVRPFFGVGDDGDEGVGDGTGKGRNEREGSERMRLVLDLDMGRR